jgi:tRNA(Arg) A34 adenosine deaminase TadA
LKRDDRYYLEIAMDESRRAYRGGYSPVGAVLYGGGTILGIYQSTREIGNIQHAEFKALLEYQAKGIIYPDVAIYSTLEPCIMCVGMATVLKVSRVVWLVSDRWAGVSRVYNFQSEYVKTRFPKMDDFGGRARYKDLHDECINMWRVYLTQTGHEAAIHYMLGVE